MALEVGSGLTIGLILVTVIVVAAMLIWVERRLLSFWQERLGPNRVGPFGLLQVVADMIKIRKRTGCHLSQIASVSLLRLRSS